MPSPSGICAVGEIEAGAFAGAAHGARGGHFDGVINDVVKNDPEGEGGAAGIGEVGVALGAEPLHIHAQAELVILVEPGGFGGGCAEELCAAAVKDDFAAVGAQGLAVFVAHHAENRVKRRGWKGVQG